MTLQGEHNRFKGLELDVEQLPDAAVFATVLPPEIEKWRQEGLRLVWLQVPLAHADLIPVAVAQGFEFHHSAPDYLMLTLSVEPDAYIPHFATHYIGAGGAVIDEEGNLLVVSERHRRDKSRPSWKLPGGALHPGEHLVSAVVREVWEETGVEAEFDHLAAFRHWHGYRFGKSDIYMVCRLHPKTRDIVKCDLEIEHCQWMPLDEFLHSPDVGDFNRAIVQAAAAAQHLVLRELPGWSQPDRNESFFHPDCNFLPIA